MAKSKALKPLTPMKRLGNMLENFFVNWALSLPPMDHNPYSLVPDLKSEKSEGQQWVFVGQLLDGRQVYESYPDRKLVQLGDVVYKPK